MKNRIHSNESSETRNRLLDAGASLMRARGYNATTVDDICTTAGVTKGGFFHYFKSKEEIAKAALNRFAEGKVKDYEQAPFRQLADPLDRVFGRLDFVKQSSSNPNHQTKGCLIGMFAQELAFTNTELRSACHGYFSKIATDFAGDLAAAKAAHIPRFDFDPLRLATFYVSVLQGSLMLAKAAENTDVVTDNIEQFKIYLQVLFNLPHAGSPAPEPAQAAGSLN